MARLIEVPRQTSIEALFSDDAAIEKTHETATRLTKTTASMEVPTTGVVRVTHDEARSIRSIAEQYAYDGVAMTISDRGLLTSDAVEGIVANAKDYDTTVLGAPMNGLFKQYIFGTVPDTVQQESANTVLMTRQHTNRLAYDRWIEATRLHSPVRVVRSTAEDGSQKYE